MESRDSQKKQISQIEDDLPVESTVPRSGPDELSRVHFSPLRLLRFIIISIFLTEVVAMIVVYELPPLPYGYVTLIDAAIMTILIFPMLYFLSFRPLLQHIQMRQQAEEANRQLSRIIQQTEDTVVVSNRDGAIEYVNPAFERLTGYTKKEALGKTPRVIKSGLHNQEFYRDMWDTILKGEVFQREIANRKKNGELFYEVKTITPLRDAQGTITHFVATGKDITQRKQAEENLRKAYDDLERRVQDRTEELQIANSELEDEINERRRAEEALQAANLELTRFNSAMVGRELRMIGLKKEVNELCGRASEPPRYSLGFEKEQI